MFGITFSDYIDTQTKKIKTPKNLSLESTDLTPPAFVDYDATIPTLWKRLSLKTFFFILLALLITRLATLQLVKGSYYHALAEENRVVSRPLQAPRGIITDRNNRVLVRNMPYIQLKKDDTPVPYKQYIDQNESSSSTKQTADVEIKSVREYAYAEMAAHPLGYISGITQEELNKNKKNSVQQRVLYSSYDKIGRTGIEQAYEKFLKGTDGSELVEINSKGVLQKVLKTNPAIGGKTIQTTLDIALQQFAFQKLQEKVKQVDAASGVVLVQKTKTGEILAMVNYPAFDNNAFTHIDKAQQVSQYFQDAKTPLLNRAISGTFAPGSTYKIVTALAGLESGKITAYSTYNDTGSVSFSGTTFNNWYFSQYGKVEGDVDVKKALSRSNDTFFYKLALATGPEALIQESYKFKLGTELGIDIPGEAGGLIPTPDWKKQTKKEIWYPGNTINMSIGQGDVLTTPLQILNITSIIANNGYFIPPTLVSKISDNNGTTLCTKDLEQNKWKERICQEKDKKENKKVKIALDQKYLQTVQEGMHLVTQKGGTAYPFFDFPIESAGKTGTAETSPDQKPHAWYTGYAPYKDPEITVTVLVEKGGEGSSVAAPIAKDIMQEYFRIK